MKPFVYSILIVIFGSTTIRGQQGGLGTWNIITIKYKHNEKLSYFGEGQLRSLQFYRQYHYHEYKFGVNYSAHKNVKLALGAGSYQTYAEGGNFIRPKNNSEVRI